MCFYYAITKKNPKPLIENKVITEKQLSVFDETYLINGFEYPKLPIIPAQKTIEFMEWGIVPKYSKSKDEAARFRKQYNTLNAKSETIFDSKIYGEAILKRRCLVICSGFYEWREFKGKKYPYYVTLKGDEIFVFGGIYNLYTDRETGEIVGSFSIVTTPANEIMSKIHNTKKRMPLILEPKKALRWISPILSEEDIKSLFIPINSEKIKAHTIKKFTPTQTKVFNNPELMAYYYYPELVDIIEKQQPGLFDNI